MTPETIAAIAEDAAKRICGSVGNIDVYHDDIAAMVADAIREGLQRPRGALESADWPGVVREMEKCNADERG